MAGEANSGTPRDACAPARAALDGRTARAGPCGLAAPVSGHTTPSAGARVHDRHCATHRRATVDVQRLRRPCRQVQRVAGLGPVVGDPDRDAVLAGVHVHQRVERQRPM